MVKGESETQVSVPVHVYGPEGVADFLDVILATSDTCLYVPVIVFEFVPGPVEDGFAELECLNERSRLYRVRLLSVQVAFMLQSRKSELGQSPNSNRAPAIATNQE
jgi:hypothetical protein